MNKNKYYLFRTIPTVIYNLAFMSLFFGCGAPEIGNSTTQNSNNVTTTTDNSKGVEHCKATITPNYNSNNSVIKCTVTLECKNNIMSVKEFIGDNALDQCNTSAIEDAGESGEVVIDDGTVNSTDNPDDVFGTTT